MIKQSELLVSTPGRSLINISKEISDDVAKSGIETGICHIFLHHTSASLIINENTDPLVLEDLEAFMQRISPDGDPLFKHIAEGPDDMPSHIRCILTQNALAIPISNHRLALGTWQGIYLWEHRLANHQRKLTLTLQGE